MLKYDETCGRSPRFRDQQLADTSSQLMAPLQSVWPPQLFEFD